MKNYRFHRALADALDALNHFSRFDGEDYSEELNGAVVKAFFMLEEVLDMIGYEDGESAAEDDTNDEDF